MAIADLLNGTLDDLKDLPTDSPFPNGTHRVTIDWDIRGEGDKEAIFLGLTAIETVESSETSEETGEPLVVAGGDTFDIRFGDNEFAQGSLKLVLGPLADNFGTRDIAQLMEVSKGAECVITTKKRKGKVTKEYPEPRTFMEIVTLSVA